MTLFKKISSYSFTLTLIFITLYKIEKKEKQISNNNIYNLRINYLKHPFKIDIKENSFSFLSNEEGPFKASLLLKKNIIESRKVTLGESYSFYLKII